MTTTLPEEAPRTRSQPFAFTRDEFSAVTAVVCAVLGAYIVAPWAPAAYAAVPAVVFPWVWSRAEQRARLSDAGILPERRRGPDIDAQVEDAIAGHREGVG